VIGAEGEQLGILSIDQALARAQEAGMDLVEVSPMAKPPVCKIMDYGKFKYEAKKKANEARKKQVVVRLKEVKLRPKTEEHDYEFKVNNIRRFLSDGDKARVTIMFRGREITHKDIGQRILSEVMTDLKDIAVMEQAPRMEGRQMFMILAPNPKLKAQAQAQARASVKPEQPRPPAPSPPSRLPRRPPSRSRSTAAPTPKGRR
jgi:translation initiation factor IF-3